MLVIVCGLPGTGKSFFCEKFSEQIGAYYVSSDMVREELGLRGQYIDQAKEKVYQQMFLYASKALAGDQSVVLDATFNRSDHLLTAVSLGKKAHVKVYVVEMVADEEIIQKRVCQNRKYSEAGPEVYQNMKESYEPVAIEHLQLDTTQTSLEELLVRAKRYIGYDEG